MKHGLLRLRTQLAAAMIGAVLLAVLFGYGGITLFVQWEERQLLRSLDIATRSAAATIERGGQPDAQQVKRLYLDTLRITRQVDHDTDRVLVALACLASLFGIWVGIAVATRLVRPIEAVSAAARALSRGDLTRRVTVDRAGSDELATLVVDFNAMADALQRFDREVSESSAAIAHELRTPLTILRTRLQAQKDGHIHPDGDSNELLIAQVDLLTRIVDDLQVLSMADSGRLDLHREDVDIADFLRTTAVGVEVLLAQDGMTLETHLEPAVAAIDRMRLRQVILALANNARFHARSGGTMLLACGPGEGRARIVVADRGPGIAEADRARVFERFWRAEPSRMRAGGGSGLGLAVCAAIVRAHGGSLQIAPRVGGGSEFTLHLP